MPLVQTRGAASAQGFGEFAQASAVPNYIEDVFSCFLYTGNGSTQTITNNIDLSTNGGLVWIKDRTSGGSTYENALTDTVRGATNELQSDTTAAQTTNAARLTSFNSNGFSIGNSVRYNNNNDNFVSWTWRKQPKYFDIQTWTGNSTNRTIAHSLGSVPGSIIVKRTDTTAAWAVYHRSLANTQYLVLNTTAAVATGATWWNSTTPTSAVFSVGTDASVNASGGTYVAYLFAHDAGGFGLTGTDNVISCGSFTTDGSGNATVSLGYEPQWLLSKGTSAGNDWFINDNMRGLSYSSFAFLNPNSSSAETNLSGDYLVPNATGFSAKGFSGSTTFIYIAIRRPMKVPTSGTSVFLPSTAGATTPFNVGFPPDLALWSVRNSTGNKEASTRLQGGSELFTNTTAAESSGYNIGWAANTNFWYQDVTGGSMINWMFRRAPSFCDVVCYTGTGANPTNVTHNLGVVPELMIVKARSNTGWWVVYPNLNTSYLALQSTGAISTAGFWNNTSPTSSVFTVSDHSFVNGSGITYLAYLFATCAGVSKVGSYTGTATTLQIDCGFTAGARFVLIKRTDSTGDWYVWDSARGIVAGNDPYLLLNSTAAEVTGTDYVDTYNAGFEISSTAPSAINASAGTFIFLAIA